MMAEWCRFCGVDIDGEWSDPGGTWIDPLTADYPLLCIDCGEKIERVLALRTHFHPPIGGETRPRHDRFWSKVKIVLRAGECWEWQAHRQRAHRRDDGRGILGYGQFRANGAMHKAHVFAFVVANGPIPRSRVVGHTCDNPACVRPSHLRAITRSQNVAESWQRSRR
jgi:hypothetical protein